MTAIVDRIRAISTRLLRSWWPALAGFLYGAVGAGIVALLVIPDNREISLKEYRWLIEQAEEFPAIRDRVYQELTDNGKISNWELYQIKKALRQQAKQDLRSQLRED